MYRVSVTSATILIDLFLGREDGCRCDRNT